MNDKVPDPPMEQEPELAFVVVRGSDSVAHGVEHKVNHRDPAFGAGFEWAEEMRVFDEGE